jgi:hypothetical protein
VTVVIGVVTVTVVPTEAVTVAVVTGVVTVTVAATVAGSVGVDSVGRETLGTRSSEDDGGVATASAVDERPDAGVSAPPEPWVDAGSAPALEPSALLK